MRSPAICFGESLSGPENEPLRRRLEAWAGGLARPLVADALLAFNRRLETGPPAEAEPCTYLLFDLQALYLFEEADGVRIDSALRHLIDGYPFRPFPALARHFGEGPFHPPFPPGSIDLLAHLLPRVRPGRLTAFHLATGEIETAEVSLHPGVHPAPAAARHPPAPGEKVMRDPSLRLGPPPDLARFVSRPAGIVRHRRATWGYASLPIATAGLIWDHGRQQEVCFGRGAQARRASDVAVCEALERYQVIQHPAETELIYAPYQKLAGRALDPRRLFFGRSPCCPADPLPELDPDLPLHWTRAEDPMGGGVLVPAQEIWFSVQDLPGETALIGQTTSGCALGGCSEEAALFALLEAIERDAYLTAWYLRRPCRRIDPESVLDERFQILRHRWELEFSDYAFHLFDITTDTAVPAVAAVAVRRRGRGPKTFHAAAARLSAESACRVALEDLGSFSPRFGAARREQARALLAEPERVALPADHAALYFLDETFGRLDFLGFGGAGGDVREIDRGALIPAADAYDLREVLSRLHRHLEACGAAAFFRDITHGAVAAAGLACVKAITPGLYPLWFGNRRRFAITPRLERLAREWTGRPCLTLADLNLEAHPLA